MADSLKTRVSRVIAGSVHAFIDRLEDQAPEAVMEQTIRNADAVIHDVRHELGLVSANRHLAQQQHAHLNGQHEKLVEQIALSLAQNREDLARAAVGRQLDIEAQIPVLETTLSEYARHESDLQGYVAALLAKKREMEEALSGYRRSRAAAAASVPPTAVGHGVATDQRMGAISDSFDRLYQRQTGLSVTPCGASLQQAAKLQELDDLVRDNKVAERLAMLKAGQA